MELRHHYRWDTAISACIKPGYGVMIPVTIRNVSRGGLFIQTRTNMFFRTKMDIHVESFSIKGKIVHRRENGVGVMVEDSVDELQMLLQQFVPSAAESTV